MSDLAKLLCRVIIIQQAKRYKLNNLCRDVPGQILKEIELKNYS